MTDMNPRESPPDPDATNTLVLASAFDAAGDDTCADMLGVAQPGDTNALFVTLTGAPDSRLDHWRSHVSPSPPANLGIVSVDESSRSTAATASTATAANGHVRSVSTPGDLTGLGIGISEYLSEWHDNGKQTVVCFHSLTPLLQYSDTRRVFQFLHVLTRRVESAGAVAHYHMDPAAHDERTLRTLSSLFDEVLEEHDADRETPAEPADSA